VLARAVIWGMLEANPAKQGVENPQRRRTEKPRQRSGTSCGSACDPGLTRPAPDRSGRRRTSTRPRYTAAAAARVPHLNALPPPANLIPNAGRPGPSFAPRATHIALTRPAEQLCATVPRLSGATHSPRAVGLDQQSTPADAMYWAPKVAREQAKKQDGAAQESNLPSVGLRRRTGFEDQLTHRSGRFAAQLLLSTSPPIAPPLGPRSWRRQSP
jgi:hypothetical protein